MPSQGWPRPLSASGSCHHTPGANRNQMWRLRGKALLFAFAQKLGAGGKVLPGQLEREGEAAREGWGLMILETLVFIFPPGSLGSRGGQGQIPQESQLWSGLSEATCLRSPSDILKWFPSIGGPQKFLTMSAEGSPTGSSGVSLYSSSFLVPLMKPTLIWVLQGLMLLSNHLLLLSAP